MKKAQLKYLFLLFILLRPFCAGAIDIGLVVREKFEYHGHDNNLQFFTNIIPRFSFLFGDTGMVFMSGELNIYKEDPFGSPFYFERKLLRSEISAQFGPWGIRGGRIIYSDPLSFINNGLLDGIHLTHTSEYGRAGVGAWYMESEHIVTAVEYEHPSIMDLFSIKTTGNGYIDVSLDDDKTHIQYFSFRIGLPLRSFYFEAGGVIGSVIEPEEDLVINQMMAGQLGVLWTLPTSFNSMLSFTGRYFGGEMNSYLVPYTPISEMTFGNVFKTEMSAISILTLDYTARISNPIGAKIAASYFIRNDLVTPNIYPITAIDKRKGFLLGGELFAELFWNPFSDMQFILGGGTFIPAIGNVWPKEKALWRIDLSFILSL